MFYTKPIIQQLTELTKKEIRQELKQLNKQIEQSNDEDEYNFYMEIKRDLLIVLKKKEIFNTINKIDFNKIRETIKSDTAKYNKLKNETTKIFEQNKIISESIILGSGINMSKIEVNLTKPINEGTNQYNEFIDDYDIEEPESIRDIYQGYINNEIPIKFEYTLKPINKIIPGKIQVKEDPIDVYLGKNASVYLGENFNTGELPQIIYIDLPLKDRIEDEPIYIKGIKNIEAHPINYIKYNEVEELPLPPYRAPLPPKGVEPYFPPPPTYPPPPPPPHLPPPLYPPPTIYEAIYEAKEGVHPFDLPIIPILLTDEELLNELNEEQEEVNKYSFERLKQAYINNGSLVFEIPYDQINNPRYPSILLNNLGIRDQYPVRISVAVEYELQNIAEDFGYLIIEYIYDHVSQVTNRKYFDNHFAYNYMYDSGITLFNYYKKKHYQPYLFITRNQEIYKGNVINGYDYGYDPEDRIHQNFTQGTTNCVLEPMIRYYNSKRQEFVEKGNKNSAKTYIRYGNKLKELSKIYDGDKNGIPETMLQCICDDLNCSIHIYDIFRNCTKEYEGKNTKHTFKLINTKFNHVDEYKDINELDNILVNSFDEMQNKYIELINDNEHFIYKRNSTNISEIITKDEIYTIDDDYKRIASEFTKKINIKKICAIDSIKNPELVDYLKDGCHITGCRDYINDIDSYRGTELNDLDHEKSYTQFKSCKYYKGFMPKPSDIFRQLLTIQRKDYKQFLNSNIGIYTISIEPYEEWTISPNIMNHFKKLNVYKENTYITLPCVEILFLIDCGVKLTLIFGCYSPKDCKFEFEFTEEMINNRVVLPSGNKEKKMGPRYYAKWSGCLGHASTNEFVYCRNDPEILKIMYNHYTIDKFQQLGKLEGRVMTKKTHTNTYHHVLAFITSYSRIQLFEQLFEFDYEYIIRVNTDGFFYRCKPTKNQVLKQLKLNNNENKLNKKELINKLFKISPNNILFTFSPKIHNNFRQKDNGIIKENIQWECFLSGCQPGITYNQCYNLPESYMSQYILKLGCGGGGKTYSALIDKGYFNPVYVAPSHKLLRAKKKDFENIIPITLSKLCGSSGKNGCLPYYDKYSPSVIICDEVTQYTNEQKKHIKKTYKYSKIIFCGDINEDGTMYQLPCVEGEPFKIDDFDTVENYNVNRRCKDEKLLTLLTIMRQCIEQGESSHHVAKCLLKNKCFKIIDSNQVQNDYNIEDYILCSRRNCTKHKNENCNCDNKNFTIEWTNKLKKLWCDKKYYITKKSGDYCTGDIIIQKNSENKPKNCIERHAFTCHAIQGETIKNKKIFIDTRQLFDNTMLYTAISRAEYWDQIYLIK
jgi:hypothetical protein